MGIHFSGEWDPVKEQFGALPFIYGTIVSSILALLISLPISIGVAVFLSEIVHKSVRTPISFLIEILAAIPSIIYGFWGIFIFAPFYANYRSAIAANHLWVSSFLQRSHLRNRASDSFNNIGDHDHAYNLCSYQGCIESNSGVTKRSSLCTRSDKMGSIKMALLRMQKRISEGAVLGLGRAIGETMAVTMVIGNKAQIKASLFEPAYSMASVIANEFAEASGSMHISSLIEVGLILFGVTFIVNSFARLLIYSVTRKA